MRVDTHPDQFNVLNSIKEDVVENTKEISSSCKFI